MNLAPVRLGDVLELRRQHEVVELDHTYRPVGVRGFGRGIFDYPSTRGADLGKLRFFQLESNRLVVSNIKGWEGAVAVTDQNEDGRIASNRFLTYAGDAGRVDLAYVKHWLLSDDGLEALGRASPGSADRNRTLSMKNFEAIEVPLPDITEQRRVATHLNGVGGAVDQATQLAAEQQKRLPLSTLPRVIELLVASVGLSTIRVGDLVDSVNDTIHPGDDRRGADEFIGLEHVESHTGRAIGGRLVGEERGRKFRFEEGDVTYGYLRPYLNKVWVADRIGLCSVEQFVLRPRTRLNVKVLGHILRSQAVLDDTAVATNRLQLPRLRLSTLLDMQIPDVRLAPASLAQRLDEIHSQFVHLESLRVSRGKLVQGILPAARNEIFSRMF